jgi:hypothetical protein
MPTQSTSTGHSKVSSYNLGHVIIVVVIVVVVVENCALLGYYATSTGNSLSTFRDNLLARYVVLKRRQGITTIRCAISQKSAVLIYFAAES